MEEILKEQLYKNNISFDEDADFIDGEYSVILQCVKNLLELKLEKAYEDGAKDNEDRCGEFDINKYI